MPVPNFLTSFADKAQTAINASPLAAHLPASMQHRPSSPDAAPQPSANEAAAQGGGAKSHTFETLQYQFRSLQQQYSTTSPVQKLVTTEKGVAIDFNSVSINSKAQSKELYTWGQSEAADLKDVTDRLAYLNFVQGSLASSLSAKLDSARGPLKALRDAETNLQPRRNIRAGLHNQIARLEHEQQKGGDKRIVDLREQLRKAESEDQQLEREVELLKRKAVRDSEQIKWDAIREYGEKLVLLSQAATPIIAVLPSVPPTTTTPYAGAQTTGAVRASLQRALDNYKTGHINLPSHASASDLSRSDTRSFGESHASELSSIHSSDSLSHSGTHATTPSPVSKPLPESTAGSPPINPQNLNNSPAPIPYVSPVATSAPLHPSFSAPSAASPVSSPVPVGPPTVAETGVPIISSPAGPGPASGSLHHIHAASDAAGPRSAGLPANETPASQEYGHPAAVAAKHESAEEEKKRLAAAYSQASQPSALAQQSPLGAPPFPVAAAISPMPTPHHETAEEEKKRLEREERERILHASGSSAPNVPPKDNNGDDLPPYQEPGQ